MSYRIFSRTVWQINDSWPNGVEPLAVPMDTCRTINRVDTQAEAVELCTAHNDERPYKHRMDECLSKKQLRSKYLAPFWEFTET